MEQLSESLNKEYSCYVFFNYLQLITGENRTEHSFLTRQQIKPQKM